MTSDNLSKLSLNDWKKKAMAVKFPSTPFIGGKFVPSKSSERFSSLNPVDNSLLAELPQCGQADVDSAVSAARKAFQDGYWHKNHPTLRIDVLNRFADLIDQNAAELALLDSLEMGKPISDMLSIDLPEITSTIMYYAAGLDKIFGQVSLSGYDNLHYTQREPLGVVGAISPWNYPMLMAVWKIAPALAAGNCVVLKPSEVASFSCLRLAELFMQAGAPEGVLNVVTGDGRTGELLARHDQVDKITFTGSTATGKKIMCYAGESNMKKVALETGGKSPQIFMSDLEDMGQAVDTAIAGIYDNAGQVCNAGSRLLVHQSILDAFVEQFSKRYSELYQIGDPLDPATSMGPLCSQTQKKRVMEKIASGLAEGATMLFGGEPPEPFKNGAYVLPTLFTGTTENMRIVREEIFGPVAVVQPFKDEPDALRIANDTQYGLAASVWTSDLKTALNMMNELQSGVCWVNCFGDGDMNQPFGGFKQSGNSRDKSMESLLSYTQTKSVWVKL